jgi:MFS family permease
MTGLAGVPLWRPWRLVRTLPAFRSLWAASLTSALGSSVTRLALPLTAALVLGAGPVEMGVLTAAGTLPLFLFALPAGVLVDRLPRRALMVVADLGRAALLASIPAAALFGQLGIEHLYAVAFLTAVLGLLHDLADTAVRPLLLGPARLADGNTALAMNYQVASLAGPSVGGLLVAYVTAPLALLVDAVSFVASAIFVSRIRFDEASGARPERAGWWSEIAEGVRLVLRDPILRAIVGASAIGQLAGAIQAPLLILFLVHELGLSPATLGLLFAAAGAGAIPGSLLARPIADRVGAGRAVAVGTTFGLVGMTAMPLVSGPTPLVVAVLLLAQATFGVGVAVYSLNHLTLRQLAAPNHLQGRANATRRFLMNAATPAGALLSGYLGEAIGLRPGLLVGAAFLALALLWTVRSPLWSLGGGSGTT